MNVRIRAAGPKVNLQKVDLETGEAVPQGDASLTGAVYGLFAREDIVHPDGKTEFFIRQGSRRRC